MGVLKKNTCEKRDHGVLRRVVRCGGTATENTIARRALLFSLFNVGVGEGCGDLPVAPQAGDRVGGRQAGKFRRETGEKSVMIYCTKPSTPYFSMIYPFSGGGEYDVPGM